MENPKPGDYVSAGQRADWVARDPEGYFDFVHKESMLAARRLIDARTARDKKQGWWRRVLRALAGH